MIDGGNAVQPLLNDGRTRAIFVTGETRSFRLAQGKALATPDLKTRLSGQGTEPAYLPPADFKAYIATEQKRWGDVIRGAKIKLD